MSKRYAIEDLAAWAAAALRSAGMPEHDARTAARQLVRSDARGYGTHGLTRMATYLDRLREGEFNPRPALAIERLGSAWKMDADGALGHVAALHLIAQARAFLADQPVLWVSVRDIGHLGALGVVALEAAEQGLVCFMGQRTPPLLGLPGFHRAAIGHNPFAFAAPAGARPPFVFDMACSVAARGHILLAAREGRSIPPEWALDPEGRPTTDARAAAAGTLQPAGGYKGMGLAMMIECLAAALAATADAPGAAAMELPPGGAVARERAFFFFIQPGLLGQPADFAAYMEHWVAHYQGSSSSGARIPGERGHASEQAAVAAGLAYTPALDAELHRLGQQLGIPMPRPRSGP